MFAMLPCIPDMHRECSPGFRNQEHKTLQGLANGLVPVLVRVVVAPLKVILLFRTRGFRKVAISLVILCQVLVVHLVFILVPLVVVTSVFVVVPLALVVWMVIVALTETEPASAALMKSAVRYRFMWYFCSSLHPSRRPAEVLPTIAHSPADSFSRPGVLPVKERSVINYNELRGFTFL